MRESLSGWLERDGHIVQTAASGEEAIEKLKETDRKSDQLGRYCKVLLDDEIKRMQKS